MSSNTNNDPRARLAQAQADIAAVDQFERQQQMEAEQRRTKKAQAISTLKATLPDVLRADIAAEKGAFTAIHASNTQAAQAAKEKLLNTVSALDKALADVRNALSEVEATYTRHDEYARHIHGTAWKGYQTIVELDRADYVQNYGEARAQLEIERVLNTGYGQFVGRLPAAVSPHAAMFMAIQSAKHPEQRRLLQALTWALTGAPPTAIPNPSDDWQPQADYQLRRD